MYYTKKLKIKKDIVSRRFILQISLFLCVFGIGIFYFAHTAMAATTSPTDCGDRVPQTFDATGFPTSYSRVKCECGDHLVSSYTMRNEDEDIDCSGVADTIGLQIDKTWRSVDEYRLYAGGTINGISSGGDNDPSNLLTLDCNGHKIIGKSAVGKAGIQNVCFQSNFSGGVNVEYYCRDYFTIKNCTITGFETGIKIDPQYGSFQNHLIHVENNTVYKSKIGINADLTYGTANYIFNNDVLDNDGGPGMLLKDVGCGGVRCSVTSDAVIGAIANNRVMTRNYLYAVEIHNVISANIYGNYFDLDCSGVANCDAEGADLYIPYYIMADWPRPEINTVVNSGIFDNVFGGHGFKTKGRGWNGLCVQVPYAPDCIYNKDTVHWCQKLIDDPSNGSNTVGSMFVNDSTGKNINNIFRDVANMNKPNFGANYSCDAYNASALAFDGCNEVQSEDTCSKTCIGSEYIAAPYNITENTCFYYKSVHVAGVTTEIGFSIKTPNVILDCNQTQNNRRTYGYNTSHIAIQVDGSSRNSIIGCALSQFRGGIQLKNSEDVLLRENIVENIHYAVNFGNKFQDFFYQVISDPIEDPKHYNHKIYNQYLDIAPCVDSPGDASCTYRLGMLNKISQGSATEYSSIWTNNLRQVVYINHPDDKLSLDGSQAIWGSFGAYDGVGHITIVNAHGIDMKNFTIDDGDPMTLVDIRGNTLSFDDVYSNTVKNNYRDPTSYSDGFRIINAPAKATESTTWNFYGNTAESNNIGFSIASSTGVFIYNNIGTDNIVGIRASDSEWLYIYGNTLSSDKEGSWGGRFYQLSYTEIGSAFNFDAYYGTGSVKTNRFNSNNEGGVYYEGNNFNGNTRRKEDQIEFNFIMQNEIANNGSFGMVMTYASSTRIIGNTINNNGVNDPVIDPVDGGLSYSPGFYINQSHNLVVRKNTIDNNSGDNLYIDSSPLPLAGKCLPTNLDNPPKPTTQNSFLLNNIINSVHGSGVFMDADSCVQADPDYAPSVSGKIYKNYFGFFYLFPTESSQYYDVTPGIDPAVYNLAYPTYGPEVHGELLKKNRVIDWPDANPPDWPIPGNNTISNNYENGITLSWHSTPNISNMLKIQENDFYKNTISENGKFGLSGYYNKANGISILGVTDESAIYGNDIIDNDISGSFYSGIYINYARMTKVFSNDITDSMWGIYTDHGSTGYPLYSQNIIGNSKQYPALPVAGLSYANTIHDISVGVNLSYDYGTLIHSNTIYDFDVAGISGHNSGMKYNSAGAGGIYVDSNTIYNGNGEYPKGIFIGSSENWQLTYNIIYNINEATKIGQYLHVGPEKQSFVYREWANDLNNYYPQTSAKTKSYYYHTIGTSNKAGPTNDAALRSIRYYNNVSSLTLSGIDTYHLQAANSSNISLTGFVNKSGADPLEIDFYSSGNIDGNGATLSNCRGECIILYGVTDVTVEDIKITSATRSGIKGFYLDGVTLDNITISGVNTGIDSIGHNGYWENGGMYLYDSVDNIITNNHFTYKPALIADAWTYQKFELFFGGGSTGNRIENNTFGSSGASSGSGAYEQRAEYKDEVYFPAGWSSAEASYLKRQSDYMCYVPSDGAIEPGDGNCDPNCTNAQDIDCRNLAHSAPIETGCNTGTTIWPDCCDNTEVYPIGDLLDCLLPMQNNFNGGTHPVVLTCHTNDDGCCYRDSGDGVCDPNCPLESDGNCLSLYPGEPACPNTSLKDDLSEDAVNCCNGLADGTCDYDCPRGFDPDCVSSNIWCENPANKNSFVNIDASLQKPNYYDITVPTAPFVGGGGIPNDALYCYYPRARFSDLTGKSSIHQVGNYRQLSLSDRAKNVNYFKVTDAWFADLVGLDLTARILTSSDGTNWLSNYFSNFIPGSEKFTTITHNNLAPDPAIPTVASTGNYRLGDFTKISIKTVNIGQSDYPADIWTNTARRTEYNFIWNAIYQKAGYFQTGYNSTSSPAGLHYAKLYAYNMAKREGSAGSVADESELRFSYDFSPIVNNSWDPIATTTSTPSSYPKTYRVEWTPITLPTGDIWQNNKAHYEVWYGDSLTEVINRANYDSTPGPYVWDDLIPGTTVSPYVASKRGALPYQSCEIAGVNHCYDPGLGIINCNSTKCVTYIKIQNPATSYTNYVIQGEYYTSDATIRQCSTGDNYTANPASILTTPPVLSDGIIDNVENFGNDYLSEVDYGDNNCGNNIIKVASLIKWDTSSINKNTCTTVSYAYVGINITSPGDNTMFKIYEVDKSWLEDRVTWQTTDGTTVWGSSGANSTTYPNPDRGTTTMSDAFPPSTASGYLVSEFNARGRHVVQNWISYPTSNNGVIIMDRGVNDKFAWNSSEYTEPPKLIIRCASTGSDVLDPKFNVCAIDSYGNSGSKSCSGVPPEKPWVQTQYGDVYSKGDVGSSAINYRHEFGTFLIRSSGSSIHSYWASQCSFNPNFTLPTTLPSDIIDCTQVLTDATDSINFPDKDNKYTVYNATNKIGLGSLDFLNKPINVAATHNYVDFNTVVNDLKNRYGAHRVMQLTQGGSPVAVNNLPNNLNGKIYYYNGSTQTNASPIQFSRAAGASGSGLIIINGNLTINQNITYSDSSSSALKEMPSVVWIVLGDITIDDIVDTVSGAFIALGTPGMTAGDCGTYSCGTINTGTAGLVGGGGAKDKKLTVNGLMFARQYNFQRNLYSDTEGAEVIIYDGRLQANPPLGLEDFIKNLPVWK